MKKYLVCFLFMLTVYGCSAANSNIKEDNLSKNQSASVSIVTATKQSSGILTKVDDKYVIVTTKHSVEVESSVVDTNRPLGSYGTDFRKCKIVYSIKQNGVIVALDIAEGKIVYSNPDLDLAVILPDKVPSSNFPVLFVSKRPGIGTRIYAIGSPNGIMGIGSVSNGIISRYMKFGDYTFCQVDALLHFGSSGCGIFNEDGECIGMVIMQDISGFGYYLPSDIILYNIVRNKNLIFSMK